MIKRETKKIKEGFVGQKMIVLPPNIKKIVTKNDLTANFYFTAIGYYPNATFHDRSRKMGSGQHILLYCVQGHGDVFIGEKRFRLSPNSFVIIPKATPHHYKSSLADPWSIYWIHFTGASADVILQRYIAKYEVVIPIPFSEKRIGTFDQIINMLENSMEEKTQEVVNIRLLNFVASFVYVDELYPASNELDPIENSILFMKNNLGKATTADELAKQQNLSPSHYSRLFRAKTGNSPLYYFNQLKVQKSCQYLYFSDRSVKEICSELGFEDPFYFSRLFKKFMGMSPSHYKHKYRSKTS